MNSRSMKTTCRETINFLHVLRVVVSRTSPDDSGIWCALLVCGWRHVCPLWVIYGAWLRRCTVKVTHQGAELETTCHDVYDNLVKLLRMVDRLQSFWSKNSRTSRTADHQHERLWKSEDYREKDSVCEVGLLCILYDFSSSLRSVWRVPSLLIYYCRQ